LSSYGWKCTTARACCWGVAAAGGRSATSGASGTCPRYRAWRASNPSKKRCPVARVLSPREERSRSRVGTWLRSMGFVVSPHARCKPVRTWCASREDLLDSGDVRLVVVT